MKNLKKFENWSKSSNHIHEGYGELRDIEKINNLNPKVDEIDYVNGSLKIQTNEGLITIGCSGGADLEIHQPEETPDIESISEYQIGHIERLDEYEVVIEFSKGPEYHLIDGTGGEGVEVRFEESKVNEAYSEKELEDMLSDYENNYYHIKSQIEEKERDLKTLRSALDEYGRAIDDIKDQLSLMRSGE